MRISVIVALVFIAFIIGQQGEDILRFAHFAANDIARDVRYWVASILR